MDDLLADVATFGDNPTILVACGFDGALAYLGDERALQQSSAALNVLLALPGTTVAVVSRRPAEEMAELMFLSDAEDVVLVLEELVGVRWRRLLVTGHTTRGEPLSDPSRPPAPPRAHSAGR